MNLYIQKPFPGEPMKTRFTCRLPRRHFKRGFALSATLSMMILLTLIAVGLLTLSTVTVRSGKTEADLALARANARLALMIALGELQKTMGPDQSVSAPAAAVVSNAAQPRLTGAWAGWHWAPTPTGSPSYNQKQRQFQRWLVSTADPQAAEQLQFASGLPKNQPDSVKLVGDRQDSQGVSTMVMAEKVKLAHDTKPGKYAWAVFDESTKAPIQLGEPKTAQTEGEEISSRNSPYRMRPDILESSLKNLKNPEKLYTLETAVFPVDIQNADLIRKRFHDFTTNSIGLLTDTANGGLKRDLTSLFEDASLPTNGFRTPNSPYPEAFTTANGAPTWTYLRTHYRKYKNVTLVNGVPTYMPEAAGNEDFVVNSTLAGVNPTPDNERLLPVLAKFQLVFSLAAHMPFDVQGRRQKLNNDGDPKGYQYYAVPNIVYDPVITLYNPYDVALDLKKIRVRIWDPPVLLKFQRRGLSTTPNWQNVRTVDDGWSRLAQFQRSYSTTNTIRKCITVILSDGNSEALTDSLKLKPGEVKVFSPRVQTGWNWVTETIGGFNSNSNAAFFDYAIARQFANKDNRTKNDPKLLGKYGVECAPGWVSRAGLQTDNIGDPRNPLTTAKYEKAGEGLLTMRLCGPDPGRDPNLADEISAEIKPAIAAGQSTTNFQVDILAGNVAGTDFNIDQPSNTGVEQDTLRSYRFNFSDPNAELWNGSSIRREFKITDIFQNETVTRADQKKPFAMIELSARTTKDQYTDTKPWLYNNMVVEGASQTTTTTGLAAQSYDVRLIEMTSFTTFPGIELDDKNRGFYGATGVAAGGGSSFVSMLHVPVAPAASLGDLIPTNLVATSLLPRVVHPLGNSRAHPLLPTGGVASNIGGKMAMDHSYLLNDSLWDSYFFSSLTDYNTSLLSPSRDRKTVMSDLFEGKKLALNTRLTPVKAVGDAQKLASEISLLSADQRGRQLAKHVAVNGAFNVNSTSVDAWRAALSSLRDRSIYGLSLDTNPASTTDSLKAKTYSNQNKTPVVRGNRPLGDDSAADAMRWAAFRTLTDDQILNLAREIVAQIKARGEADHAPLMTLGEFVNRRIGSSSSIHSTAGLLQTAIENSQINKAVHQRDSKTLSIASVDPKRKTGIVTPSVMDGDSAEGAPTVITQGDLMQGLASIATVRGDTFKIRAYGEALDASGTTVLARTWCEAEVQRTPEFVETSDAPETEINNLQIQANKTFGRRFVIVSFKYLNENEL